MSSYKKRHIIFLLIVCVYSINLGAGNVINTIKLDKYIKKSRKGWGNPGLAVALIGKDGIIWSKGYGYTQNIQKDIPIDNNTDFFIASNTKAFTSAALSILFNKNEISWETPVVKIIPEFNVYNESITDSITFMDALSHRTGYKTFSGDLIWYGTKYNRSDIIQHLKYLPLSYSFRSHFGYSNIMYMVAGQAIPKIINHSWEDFVKNILFYQLEMKNTYFSLNEIKNNNLAIPYIYTNNKMVQVDYIDWNNIAPAGSIFSNINDLSKWVRLWINYGNYKGNQIIDSLSIDILTSLITEIPLSNNEKQLFPLLTDKGYGMGWYIYKYNNKKIIEHSGGALGMVSQITILPENDLALIVLTNSNNYLPLAIHYYLLDLLYNNKNTDWSSLFLDSKKYYDNYVKNNIQLEIDSVKKLSNNKLPYKKIEGKYFSELYGEVVIEKRNDSILCEFIPSKIYTGLLEPLNHNLYSIRILNDPSLPPGIISFDTDNSQNVTHMEIEIPNLDFDFKELNLYKLE